MKWKRFGLVFSAVSLVSVGIELLIEGQALIAAVCFVNALNCFINWRID